MKLKDGFITQDLDGVSYIVPVGGELYKGIVRANSTAAFIVELLKKDITEEQLIDALCENYDAPRNVIAEDAGAVLSVLRKINALDEG